MDIRANNILLVEDNPADSWLFREAMKLNAWNINLHVVTDGVQAMDYLRGAGLQAPPARPDLILLDLNLPRKDGRQLLAEIKADSDLRRIPVIILTTSSDSRDVRMAYDLSANCFIRKPVELDQFCAMVERIRQFWLGTVQLPGN
ncbi:MAG: response regulator [Planctomycetes bacterium]|nr:response regulator [Planctomycetota bacterium]